MPHDLTPLSHAATAWLELLANAPNERARFVEHLRATAARLDGSEPNWPAETIAKTSVLHAQALRDAAAALCDHADVRGDRCRFCEALVG